MIITRETDYAVRILRSLINLRLKNIREISDEQLIPRQFAYKISKKMERAGYIEIKMCIRDRVCIRPAVLGLRLRHGPSPGRVPVV